MRGTAGTTWRTSHNFARGWAGDEFGDLEPLAMTRAGSSLVLDAGLFVAFCALNVVPLTGLPVHEWLGFAFGGAALIHLLLSWSWIESSTRSLFSRDRRDQVNYSLNFALFATLVVLILSGAMISHSALPALGLHIKENLRWRRIHGQATNVAIALVGLHVALNWDWIAAMCRARRHTNSEERA
jgi:hypothetical protein